MGSHRVILGLEANATLFPVEGLNGCGIFNEGDDYLSVMGVMLFSNNDIVPVKMPALIIDSPADAKNEGT